MAKSVFRTLFAGVVFTPLAFVGSMVPVVMGASVSAMFLVLVGGGFIAHVVGEIGRILMYQ